MRITGASRSLALSLRHWWQRARRLATRVTRLKWYYIYFVLAAFDVLTVSAGLYLNHKIILTYTRSVEINRVWDERIAAYSQLGELAAAVNAPGNDVFDSRQVDEESRKMRAALEAFNQQLAAHRKKLQADLEPAVAAPLLANLDDIAAAMKQMTDEAELIFAYFHDARPELAGKRMATMDRKYAKVLTTLMHLRAEVAEIQAGNFDRQAAAAASLQKYEYMIGALILLMVAGATFYGHRIARQVQSDAEERQRHLEALGEAEARTRCILDTAADGIITFDENGRIESFNQAADCLLGYAGGEAIGQDIRSVIQALAERLQTNPVEDSASALPASRGESIARRRDGTTFPVELSVSQVRIGQRTIFTAIVRDVTDRRKAAEALQIAAAAQAANRAKSTFLAAMSHEIRTPINGVMGALELALQADLRPEQREYLHIARTSADALLQVINDILDFSRVESSKLQFEAIDFNLRGCLNNALATLGIRAREKGLELVSCVAPEIPESLVGDPGRLRQIVLNLVGNAIKFTERGYVSVDVQQRAGNSREVTLDFAIRDTGIGISPENRARIFAPFEQGDGSITRKYGGTGLGLAISAQLVDAMGGSIWVESEVGKGSSFHFTARLGRADSRPKSLAGSAPSRSASPKEAPLTPTSPEKLFANRSLRILLAEDNLVNQKIAMRMLQSWGLSVEVAGNGREALAKLDQGHFDLVLMDIQMPEMDGFETTEAIREREARTGGHIPIIAITAHAMESDRIRCLEAGMDNYISKPLNMQELFGKLASVISAGAPASELQTGTRALSDNLDRISCVELTGDEVGKGATFDRVVS